ncbi:MAG: glycine cleavage system protein GcvH [Pseudomonadota bacterium]
MSLTPDDLRYTKDHEWVRIDESGIAICGITDHAQEIMDDIIFVELPEPGKTMQQKDHSAIIESEKSVFDVHSPVSGKIVEINSILEETPEIINDDPYGEGWLFKIALKGKGRAGNLLDADEYREYLEQDAAREEEDDEDEEEDDDDEYEE